MHLTYAPTIFILMTSLLFSNLALANTANSQSIETFCQDLAKKLRTVSFEGCINLNLKPAPITSEQNRVIPFVEVLPNKETVPQGRILFIGGIHGDEYASISLTYLWLQHLQKDFSPTPFHWLVLPLANPDGLFRNPATRANANSVDLNRNFPSPDWDKLAIKAWKKHYNSNKRRYPGSYASSEKETQLLVSIIKSFNPDAIIAIHAPYGLLDYDGPEHAQPDKIGHLKLRPLGTFPGSLGRYAGEYLEIPVLTLELKSAGSMPNQIEIQTMLQDLEQWVHDKIEQQELDM